MAADPSLERLGEIEHIVVLMMENRSFDQMLGYLKKADMPDVEGLAGTESNADAAGNEYEVFEWGPGETVFQTPDDHTGKVLDPDHSKKGVAEQLADANGGFVENFLNTRSKPIPPSFNGFPMGHFGAQHLPTYDFLAHNYCVCDAWHSAVPGDTWPNRQFALAGREGPKATKGLLEQVPEALRHLLHVLEEAPIYDDAAFTRQLEDDQWRWYSHDPATLRAVDSRYRDFTAPKRDNFAFFNRQKVSLVTEALELGIVTPDSFLDDAANNRLRDVSWIDPNFIDLKVLDPNSNDDHPPSDIRAGQALVLEVYEALRNSKDWNDTLLVVVYDEHGGFYDHVPPPALDVDDGSGYATHGVRVPALVIGPRVAHQVSHERFDHTSLIKTILLRFARDPAAAIAAMGARVEHAQHLGALLTDTPRNDVPPPAAPREAIDAWHVSARAERRGSSAGAGPSQAPDGAGHKIGLHDFQEDFARFALAMRSTILRHGEP